MNNKLLKEDGFTLVELVVVIIILGILALAGINAVSKSSENAKYQSTLREMEALKIGMVGDERLLEDGKQVSFGYVGDVGELPPSLEDLITNVASKTNWNGPYMAQNFDEDPNTYKNDGWDQPYTYTLGTVSILSSGGGTSFSIYLVTTKARTDIENNDVTGIVMDREGNMPIATDVANIHIVVTPANGTPLSSVSPGTDGMYTVPNVPIGIVTVSATHDSVTGFSPESWNYPNVRVYPSTGGQKNIKFNQILPGWY